MKKRCYLFGNDVDTPTTELLKSIREKVKVYKLNPDNSPVKGNQSTDFIVVDSGSVKDFYDALEVETERIEDREYVIACPYGHLVIIEDYESLESWISTQDKISD